MVAQVCDRCRERRSREPRSSRAVDVVHVNMKRAWNAKLKPMQHQDVQLTIPNVKRTHHLGWQVQRRPSPGGPLPTSILVAGVPAIWRLRPEGLSTHRDSC